MKPIDFHCHAFPDFLAKRAIDALQQEDQTPAETDGTAGGLVELMDRFDIEQSVVCSIATRPEQAGPILKWSLEIQSDRLIPFGSIHPDSASIDDEIQAIRDAGLKGIKLHPLYQDFAVDDPKVRDMFGKIRDSGLILLIHAGLDIAFGENDLAEPRRFVPVLDDFPGMKIVLAHLGGWKRYAMFLDTLVGRDVWIDTSFAEGYCTPAERDEILKRHDGNRILFASDSPWGDMQRQIAFVEEMPIDDVLRERIFRQNALDLLALS